MDRFNFNPQNGFLDVTTYSNPQNENEVRTQLQSLHTQTQNFINGTLKTAVDTLQSHEVESITSSDNSVDITKTNKTIDLKVSVSGGGATVSYVDYQDNAKLTEAKSYADTKLTEAKSYSDAKLTEAKTYTNTVVSTRLGNKSIVVLTQSEYNAMSSHDANTLYFIKG